jgi:hypothetical protein
MSNHYDNAFVSRHRHMDIPDFLACFRCCGVDNCRFVCSMRIRCIDQVPHISPCDEAAMDLAVRATHPDDVIPVAYY